jgi:predicted TIM-barrel fold metal-dependent hydrolase
MPLVIDHMGRMDAALGIENPGFQTLCRLLAEGRAWTKISGADRLSASGAPYADVDPMAAAVIKANIENIVWGADWPHIAYFDKPVPDDGDLLNLLARWLPDANDRQKVLVDNPARLYGWSREYAMNKPARANAHR